MNDTTRRPARRTERKDWLAFDRSDRIGLTILLWLVGALTLVASVGLPILRWIQGEPISLPLSSAVTVPELDRTGVLYSPADYAVDYSNPGAGARILDLLPGVLLTAVVLACIAIFLRIMRSISSGQPFAAGQVGRWRAIAFLLMIGPAVAFFARMAVDGALASNLDLGGLDPMERMTLPWLPMTIGLVASLIAEAFKVGAKLSDDVDGLI